MEAPGSRAPCECFLLRSPLARLHWQAAALVESAERLELEQAEATRRKEAEVVAPWGASDDDDEPLDATHVSWGRG